MMRHGGIFLSTSTSSLPLLNLSLINRCLLNPARTQHTIVRHVRRPHWSSRVRGVGDWEFELKNIRLDTRYVWFSSLGSDLLHERI